MRVTVLFNDDRALENGRDAAAVQAVAGCADAVVAACRSLGHQTTRQAACGDVAELSRRLAKAELVFNLAEALDGDPQREADVARLLERLRLPYTGSAPDALWLGLHKPLAKAALVAAGLPVARGVVLSRGDEPLPDAKPPWIVKPSHEDASHGIDAASVVHDEAGARARARFVIDTYRQPALVEELLPGRELNLGVVGEELLDPSEIDYSALPASEPRIMTYAAKWDTESDVYQKTPPVAARLDAAEHIAFEKLALAAFRAIGLRDYGRIDIRLASDGRPVVLEVNPNPDLSPDAGLARAAARSGVSYEQLVGRILESAQRRAQGPRPG